MTQFMHRVAATGVAAAVGVAALGAPGWAQDAASGNSENGKRIYLAVGCFTCHGRAGQGGAYNGPVPSLAKTVLPFEGFKFQLRNPVQDMPAYAEMVMSEKDIADIYAFVQSLPGRRDPKDFPLLNN